MKKVLFLVIIIAVIFTYQENIENDLKELPMVNEEDQSTLESVTSRLEEKSDEGIYSYVDNIKEKSDPEEDTVHIDAGEVFELMKQNADEITMNDKYKIISMALRNFSMKEINDWKDKFIDGVTEKEKEQFMTLVYGRLSKGDMTTLKQIALKYAPSLTAKMNRIEKAYSSR